MPRSIISDIAYKLDMEKVNPVSDYVLVEVLERNRSQIGLIMPGKEKSECLYGRVIRVGPGEMNPETGETYPIGVKPGDIIMSVQYMGEKIEAIGKKFKLIREHGIWAKLKLKIRSELDWDIEEIEPYRDHLLLTMDPEEKSQRGKGKIFIPNNPQTMFRMANVVKLGPGLRKAKASKATPIGGIEIGDRVICLRYAGCVMKMKGIEYRMASEDDIQAVANDGDVDTLAGQDSLPKPVDDYGVIPDSHLAELNTKTLMDSGGKRE